MKIINQYKNTKTQGQADCMGSFVLGNGMGDFLYRPSEETRYQGFYFADNDNYEKKSNIYKIIDEIKILDRGEITSLKNNFFKIETESADKITEDCFLPHGHSALCIKTSKQVQAEVTLDIRHPYDNRQMGRFYEMEMQGNCLVVKYTKRRDMSEDGSEGKKEFSLFLAIKTDKGSFEKIGEFLQKYYPKDHKRDSYPWNRYVYKAFKMNFKQAVFAAGKTAKDAVAEAEETYKNFEKLYKKTRDNCGNLQSAKITDMEIKMACLCAQNSIRSLLISGKNAGAYAGIPWFFQFWHRDEALSLSQICKLDKKAAEEIITSQLDGVIKNNSFLRQRFPESAQDLQSADAIGILARQCYELFKGNYLVKSFKEETIKKFEKIVPKILKERVQDGLVISYPKETWMDSLEREGLRIEIQAGVLAIYKLLFNQTGNDQYKVLLEDLEREVLNKFYKNDKLLDAPDDETVRPNIFLAHFLYPELLSKEKWEKCFDKILPELYLEWGGIASISQTDERFVADGSKENSGGYHNGNSWYFMNNMAAATLYKVNPSKYSEYINKIMEASTREILYMGAIGHHGEISSAQTQQSLGCEAQLWSSAMYLEFFDVVMGK